MTTTKCAGAVLVMTLIYLLLISLLAITAVETSLLAFKMVNNFSEQTVAFQNAETLLATAENTIREKKNSNEIKIKLGSYGIEKISPLSCGAEFYKVSAEGLYLNAKSHLESIYIIPLPSDLNCTHPHYHLPKRILWRQLS